MEWLHWEINNIECDLYQPTQKQSLIIYIHTIITIVYTKSCKHPQNQLASQVQIRIPSNNQTNQAHGINSANKWKVARTPF